MTFLAVEEFMKGRSMERPFLGLAARRNQFGLRHDDFGLLD